MGGPAVPRVLVVDNYDSFTFNLVHLLERSGARTEVVSNDALDAASLLAQPVDAFVISAGPCTPNEAGVSLDLIASLCRAPRPLLGLCLGAQCIAQALGGSVERATQLMHGSVCAAYHDGRGLFEDLPQPLEITRYNSLVVSRQTLPASLEVSARDDNGDVMALRHRELPFVGLQFHPESFLSPGAAVLITRWCQRVRLMM